MSSFNILVFPLVKPKTKKSNFHQVGGLVTKKIFLLFIYNESYSTWHVRQIQLIFTRNTLSCYSCLYYFHDSSNKLGKQIKLNLLSN